MPPLVATIHQQIETFIQDDTDGDFIHSQRKAPKNHLVEASLISRTTMVRLDAVRPANQNLIKSQTQPLVAVFVGGTSGIGEYTLRQLATTHGDQGNGLKVYLVGRNAKAAETIIKDCVALCPKGQFRFVQAQDLSLMKDVDRVCEEIIQLEKEGGGAGKVDMLFQSQAYLSFESRRETKEGLDTVMSLLYYSRMRFTVKLLPLLLASTLPSAHVVSIYAAGKEAKLFPDDLSLRNLKDYGLVNARSHVTYMKTFFMETLAEQNPGRISLVHVFPSLVMTNGFDHDRLPTWFKVLWKWVAAPTLKFVAVPADQCGQRTLFLATERYPAKGNGKEGVEGGIAMGSDGKQGSGAYNANYDGEIISTQAKYVKFREEGMQKKAYEHTMQVFKDIETNGVFSG